MIKPIVEDLNLERSNRIALADRIEIVQDDADPLRIEIYILDQAGERVEGGTFDKDLFMTCVLQFYNQNY